MKIDQKENLCNTMITSFMGTSIQNPTERAKLIKEKTRLRKTWDANRPKSTLRFVKDKTGKYITKEFPNKTKNRKFMIANNKIRQIERKLYGSFAMATPRMTMDKKGKITGHEERLRRKKRR